MLLYYHTKSKFIVGGAATLAAGSSTEDVAHFVSLKLKEDCLSVMKPGGSCRAFIECTVGLYSMMSLTYPPVG
jgi:hypothetical protein